MKLIRPGRLSAASAAFCGSAIQIILAEVMLWAVLLVTSGLSGHSPTCARFPALVACNARILAVANLWAEDAETVAVPVHALNIMETPKRYAISGKIRIGASCDHGISSEPQRRRLASERNF
jgi:hypothetical protein